MSSLPIDATHLKAVLSPPPPSFSFHAVSDPIMSNVIHCCSVLYGEVLQLLPLTTLVMIEIKY